MRRLGLLVGAASLVPALVAGAPWLRQVRRSWARRVAVEGHSMAPTLVAGDWLLVDPAAYRCMSPLAGELAVVPDPRQEDRWLVKRVTEVLEDGRLALAGDHPAHGRDDERIPPVTRDTIVGRPWLRYWPLRRAGPV